MFENIYNKFKLQNIVGKFIYANVGVYIIVVLIGVFSVLFNVADTGRVFVRFFVRIRICKGNISVLQMQL